MNTKTDIRSQTNWGIIWAIAAKDILDAIKNKMVLGIMIGMGIMLMTSQMLPLLLSATSRPTALVYDPSGTDLIRGLSREDDFRLYRVGSLEALEKELSEIPEVRLGLVLPPDFETQVASGNPINLPGYAIHWAQPAEVAELAVFFEEQLTAAAGVPIRIQTTGNTVLPPGNIEGFTIMAATTLTIILFTTGSFLSPYLFLEEKESHTMDALLVSPAGFPQIAAGKALAGLFYCLLGAAVVFAFNARMLMHPAIFWLGVICGSLFVVSLGLLLGIIFNSTQTLNMWVGLLFLLLLAPLVFVQLLDHLLPDWAAQLISYFPTVAISQTARLAYAGPVDYALLTKTSGSLLIGAALLLLLTIWRMQALRR